MLCCVCNWLTRQIKRKRLQHLGIDVRPYITDKGRKRISYALEELKVRGSKIHNGSFPKLISQRGIDFNETRDTPALEAAFQGEKVILKNEQLLSWSKINKGSQKNNLDLNYWLPEKLKIITQQDSNQEIVDPKQWQNVQQKLLDNYGIPEQISTALQKNNLISASDRGNPIWHKHNLLGSSNNHFWFEAAANDNGNPIQKIVITSSPVEAVSAYLVNDLIKKDNCPCCYVSFETSEQIKELDFSRFDTIVISSNDQQLFPDNIPNLVVEKDVSSWQQSWLIRWHEIQKIMESEARAAASARKKNSLSKKTSKKERQLEL